MSDSCNPLLFNLLSPQIDRIRLVKYDDEFVTLKTIREQRDNNFNELRTSWLHWLNSLEIVEESVGERIERSTSLREQGNKLYKAAPKKNALATCRLYTAAILVAPPKNECLALAHANRAMALLEFGYYQQAYDDCECALEEGYAEKLHHKLWMRQAFCARHLGDAERLKEQLDKLYTKTLNDKFGAQVDELNLSLKAMQAKESNKKKFQENNEQSLVSGDYRQSQRILKDKTRGRFMVATQFIDENEIIFEEEVCSFVPISQLQVCQQCASTEIIPFPCYNCQSKVGYCSLKCRRMHSTTHSFECAAYKLNLFRHIGIGHLALRMVLDNVTKWSPLLRSGKTPEEVWKIMMKGESVGSYGQSLQMITHLRKMSLSDIIYFALLSEILVLYLNKFTQFFRIITEEHLSNADAEVITGSLILLHIGQLISNGHTVSTICCASSKSNMGSLKFNLMSDNLWTAPGHLLCGQLHQFKDVTEAYTANYPYLSLCNHSCNPSFIPKFSGQKVTTFATRPISADEEIFNCYTNDFRNSSRSLRQMHLTNSYNFECKCFHCSKTNADEEFNKFHKYRCSQPHCRKVFTPLVNEDDLHWWNLSDDLNQSDVFLCTYCKTPQNWLQSYDYFINNLDIVQNEENRKELYTFFNKLDDWLIEYHQLKLIYGHRIVSSCYQAYLDGVYLSPIEFSRLTKILKFVLRGVALQNRKNSLNYVAAMTYFWDFIALGKYKPTNEEMSEMLHAITILSDDFQKIFLNYYNDYIVKRLDA